LGAQVCRSCTSRHRVCSMGGVFASEAHPPPSRQLQHRHQSVPQAVHSAPRQLQHSPQTAIPVQRAAQSAPAPIQISVDAGRALRSHESDLASLVGSLRPRGKDVYRALLATMSAAAMRDDIVHFESALRKTLEDSVGNSVELERIASGQWQCSFSEETFVVSIRTEVLGASFSEGFALLSELKGRAVTVRSMLLGNKAEWMRQLAKKPDRTEFLDACRRAPGQRGNARGCPQDGLGWEDDLCPFCDRPESSARLAGQHRCRVVATFRCPQCQSQWSSKQARFNPEEERVLGQKCKTCDQLGELLRWNFSDAPYGGSEGSERERKPHRSDLCEACSRFGNCQGAFFEPFIISSAIALLTKQSGVGKVGRRLGGQCRHLLCSDVATHLLQPRRPKSARGRQLMEQQGSRQKECKG